MPVVRNRLLRFTIIFLAFFALAVLVTWPLILRMGSYLPAGTDSLVHYWNGWSSLQALKEGKLPYFTPYLFHPDGLSMVYHNFAWLQIFTWLALSQLISGFSAYNLIIILNLALCGVSVFWLAKELIEDERIAFFSGVIYLAWPHRMTQPSHPNLASTWAIPLFLLFLTRLVKYKRWQDGLWAGLTLALVGYIRWQLLIGAVLVGGLYLLFILPGNLNRDTLRGLILSGIVAVVALLPPVLLLAGEWRSNPTDLFVESDEVTMQTDVLAYLTPAGSNPLFGSVTEPLYETYYADRGSRSSISPYLGLLPLLLVILAVWKAPRKQILPWLVIAIVLILLALGPTLRIYGRQYASIPMPYALADRISIFRLLREPDRFNMFLALPVAILSGYGLRQVLRLIHRRRYQNILVVGAGAVIVLEYMTIPMSLQPTRISPMYEQMAEDPGEYAIVNVPVDPYKSKPYMFAQTVHGRPILQGHSSRYPGDAFTYLENQPWLQAMAQFDEIPPKALDISRQLNTLADDGFGYVVLHKEYIGQEYLQKWRTYFAISPRYEDDEIVVYSTRPEAGRDIIIQTELLPGFGIIEAVISANCITPGAVLSADLAWGTTAGIHQKFDVQFVLTPASGSEPIANEFAISEWPTDEWEENTVTLGNYDWQTPVDLEPGDYQLTATLLEENQPVGGEASLENIIVQPDPCTYPTPPSATALNAVYDETIRLIAYNLQEDGREVLLTLFWRAERHMSDDYKIFVHVFDQDTSIPVAQDDAMPRHWTYPTSFWGLNEIIDDTIPISIEDVPPGEYGIAIGVYDSITGERLQLVDGTGASIQDGRLILPEVIQID